MSLLHDLFREQARQHSSLPAVSDGKRTLTYKDLDDLTDQLAAELQARGACVDSCVVIYMSKSIDYVVSYIAILKAGAAYLPMDAAYPIEMVNMVLQDAQPKVVIVSPVFFSNVKDSGIPVLELSAGWEDSLMTIAKAKSTFINPVMNLDSLAYVVYSSGTTGKPKGICCPHRGAVHSYLWRGKAYPYGPPGTEREAANVFFVWELLRPLIHGQQLFVIPDNVIYDPVLLPQFLKAHSITRMLFTPSLLDAMLGGYSDKSSKSELIGMTSHGVPVSSFSTLKLIILCGEVVTVALRNKCRELIPKASIHNLYSISECHDVSGSDLTNDSALDLTRTFCPVGKALPEVQIHILDEGLRECPAGVQGEIYIGGPTLARGYLRRPDLNKERFIILPSKEEGSPPIRLYRTGDNGYLVSGGRLEICGRCDSMVKVRGYSIELRAVQMAIIEHCSMVTDCLVVAHGDAADTDKTLVAYLVCTQEELKKDGENAVRKVVRATLKKRLPFYMIPTYFTFLDTLPLHPASGKLDMKRLPSVESIIESTQNDSEDYPSTPTEKKLASLFLSVLSLPESTKLDATASFFDLGGHSLLTTPLLQGIESVCGKSLTLDELFKFPTVRSIADLIDGGDAARAAMEVVDLSEEVGVHYRGKDISMQIRAFWRHIDMESLNKTSRILLTGAAGFLGAFLLHKLLATSHAYVLVLVRPSSGASSDNLTPLERCRERVWNNLLGYGLATEIDTELTGKCQITRHTFDSRVNVLVGDTSLGGLGLDSDDHAYLAQHIDVVVHAAAQVNLLYPYSALAGANVHGTAEIVHFCTIGKVKPLHYISSNSVLPMGSKTDIYEEDSDISLISNKLEGGYAQSKWVAEQLVYTAMKGGLPAVVYRCGNLSGDSTTAAWNKRDSNLQFIQACIVAGAAPIHASDNTTPLHFEMTPVDFVASFIIANVFKIREASQKTFHCIQPESGRCKVSDFLRLVQGIGFEILAVPLDEWLNRQAKESRQFSATEIEELFGTGSRVGHRVITEHIRHLHSLGALAEDKYPVGDMSQMRNYLKILKGTELLPALPSINVNTPLQGRVIVVTGASSGIGQCIARHLIDAGARVALLARRESRLNKLVEEFSKSKSVACVADVTDKSAVASSIATAEAHFRAPVWGLVNCAGVKHYQRLSDCDTESWDNQIDVNCKGVLNCVSAVLPSLKSYRRGHIVNITSDAGKKVFDGLAVYSASKFFVEAFSQGLRKEVAPLGIKVTNVQPGDVKTEILTHSKDQDALAEFGPPALGAETLEPDDVACTVVFALTQKGRCAVNELLVEPSGCPI